MMSQKPVSRSALRLMTVALAVLAFVGSVAAQGPITPCMIDPAKSLFITDVSVVDDPVRTRCWTGPIPTPLGCPVYPTLQSPAGVWTFGSLMTNMAGSTNPSVFVENWLRTWLTPQIVNGFTVFDAGKAAFVQNLINQWRAASGGAKRLNLCIAPFRLTGIVYRPDLASFGGGGYGGSAVDSAGEGRFIYNILDMNGNPTSGNVIFEFNLPAESCEQLQLWARRWHQLSSMPFGPCFNEALQAITDDFTAPNRMPARPNGSALNQLRTNEITFGFPWEFREWNIILQILGNNASGQLKNVTTKQTPDDGHNNSVLLETYINTDQIAILNNTHVVPEDFLGLDFLGGQARNFPTIWDAPNIDNSMGQRVELRHKFALQTCQGCHFFEVATFFPPDLGGPSTPFVHITGRTPGTAANLSGFLLGISNVPDPVDPSTLRNFNDLDRRANILCRILGLQCNGIGIEPNTEFMELNQMMTSSVH